MEELYSTWQVNIFHPDEGVRGSLPPDGPWQAQLQGFYYMLTAHVGISTLQRSPDLLWECQM